jgi:hypothetical protein
MVLVVAEITNMAHRHCIGTDGLYLREFFHVIRLGAFREPQHEFCDSVAFAAYGDFVAEDFHDSVQRHPRLWNVDDVSFLCILEIDGDELEFVFVVIED